MIKRLGTLALVGALALQMAGCAPLLIGGLLGAGFAGGGLAVHHYFGKKPAASAKAAPAPDHK